MNFSLIAASLLALKAKMERQHGPLSLAAFGDLIKIPRDRVRRLVQGQDSKVSTMATVAGAADLELWQLFKMGADWLASATAAEDE